MFRLDKTGHLCETPPNFAKGNRLTNNALEEMVIERNFALKLRTCAKTRNTRKAVYR